MRQVRTGYARQADQVFFTTFAALCARVAAADGSLNPKECDAFRTILRNVFKLKRSYWKNSHKILRDAVFSNQSLQIISAQFFELFKNQRPVLINTIDLLYRLARADGLISVEEEKTIRAIAHIFALTNKEYLAVSSQYIDLTQDNSQSTKKEDTNTAPSTNSIAYQRALQILGCKSSDNFEEITRSYRKLLNDYHPDKIQAKGLPEGFIQFANLRVAEITQSYDLIKTLRADRAKRT